MQVAGGAKRCDVMRLMGRHVCALRACPDRTSAPETSATRLAWGSITFSHVRACHYTSISLLPHTATCYMLNGTDGWWVWREHTILIQPGIRILVYKLCTIATLSLWRFRGTRPLAGSDLRSSETDCGARPGRVRLEEALCFCMRAVVHCMCLRALRKHMCTACAYATPVHCMCLRPLLCTALHIPMPFALNCVLIV